MTIGQMEYSFELKTQLMTQMMEYVTERRRQLFEEIVQNRTRHLTIVLENIYQPHNASAVLRSCDLTGVQDVHIIENSNTYTVNPEVAMGASKWLTLKHYNASDNNTPDAYAHLREQGYKIVATTPNLKSVDPDELDLSEKVALIFGTELTGLSPYAIENADEYLQIPMMGFTESYNISVSAALSLYTLTRRLHKSEINWKLTDEEMTDIKLQWLRNSIKRSEVIEKELLQKIIS